MYIRSSEDVVDMVFVRIEGSTEGAWGGGG